MASASAPSRGRRSSGTRSGATSGANVETIGLREFRQQLKQAENPRRWTTELGRSQRDIAKKVAGWSQFAASGMGGPQGHFAGAIKGRGGATGAYIQIADEEANMAFWGGKKRTGWYTRYRFKDSPRAQHPAWVGNSWDVGVAGQGPYAINDTIAERLDDIQQMYGEAVDRIWGEALAYSPSTF